MIDPEGEMALPSEGGATSEVALKPGSFAPPPHQSEPAPRRFSDLLDAGFAVFPLRARSKEPGAKWDQYRDQRRATASDAAEWDATDRNVAVITGAPSGTFVLDLDGPDAEQTARDKGWVADTYTVATGRGKHLDYQLPDFSVRNGAGKLARHVDVRGGAATSWVPEASIRTAIDTSF
jgi:hypothetical protein